MTSEAPRPLVTFDLFSALIDSRAGGTAVLDSLARERRWRIRGDQLYDEWDRRNKALQRSITTWLPYVDLCRTAMEETYASLELEGRPHDDADRLLASVGDWPLWPDVIEGLATVRAHAQLGVLSNVDDAVYTRTAVARLGVPPGNVLTSERLQAYKPALELYQRAIEARPDLRLHVASSARDVRGALEAGLPTIRLARHGHSVDAAGPQPTAEVHDLAAIAEDPRLRTAGP